jgi:hypothetical protein
MTMISPHPSYPAGLAGYLVFVCWLIFGWGGPQVTAAVGALGFVAFSALACAANVAAARAGRGSVRFGWVALAVGFLGWVAGSSVWAYYEVVRQPRRRSRRWPTSGSSCCRWPWGWYWHCAPRTVGCPPSVRCWTGSVIAAALFLLMWVTVLERLFFHSPRSTPRPH